MKSKKGFTLIELLVVVLIIGILAAIAVPQYQKAVLKSRLHTGIPIVASLYQAQQAYYLAHGEYASDVDALDISIPTDDSCTKQQTENYSRYVCSFGTVGLSDGYTDVQFKDPNNVIAYTYYVNDLPTTRLPSGYFAQGSKYCFAKKDSKIAQSVCESFGGEWDEPPSEPSGGSWALFRLN